MIEIIGKGKLRSRFRGGERPSFLSTYQVRFLMGFLSQQG